MADLIGCWLGGDFRCLCRALLCQGKPQGEHRADVRNALNIEGPAAPLNDPETHGEAEPRPAAPFGRKERVENPLFNLIRDPGAVITANQDAMLRLHGGGEPQRATTLHGVERVVD